MTKEQAAEFQALKDIIVDFCLHDMVEKGCVNCPLNAPSACILDHPSLTSLKDIVKQINEVREAKTLNEDNTKEEN